VTIPLKYAAGDLLYMLPQEPALSLSFDLGEGLVETGRIRDVLNLKFERLSNALSRLSLRFDSIAEMHMREQMRMTWEKGLPEYIAGLPTPPVPHYIARAGDLPLPSSVDFFRHRQQVRERVTSGRDAVGRHGRAGDAGARQYDKRRPICRRASMHRPRELEYERPEWRKEVDAFTGELHAPDAVAEFMAEFCSWRKASSRGIAVLKRNLKKQEDDSKSNSKSTLPHHSP
jgi:hypothetical protein